MAVKDEDIEKIRDSFNRGYEKGIREVVKWVRTHKLMAPDKDSITQFSPFYQIELRELKDWGNQ